MGQMKKLLFLLVVIAAIAAVACGGGREPEAGPAAVAEPASPAAEAPAEESKSGPAAGEEAFKAAAALEKSAPGQAPGAATGGVFTRLWADPPTLDPHLTTDTTSAGIVVEVFSGLVALDTDLRLVPDIAESWTVEGGVVYTFKLRDNARFHNGDPVTAHDFKWSLERAANPKTASPVADTYLNDIVGAMDFIEDKATEISGIKAIDDQTLQITIDAPKAYFLAKLTYPTAYVVHRDTVDKGGRNWWVDNPVGTGPFKLKEYRIGERIILERFDDFYREPANVKTVVNNLAGGQPMAMYESDEIDITGVGLFDLDRVLDPDEPLNKDLVIAPPSFSISYIGFNVKPDVGGAENPLQDPKFRQALNRAIDKQLIASEVLSELVQPAYGILPPGFPGFNNDLQGLQYDPGLAITLLSESAYPDYLGEIQEGSPHYELARSALSKAANAGSGTPRIIVTVPGTGGSPGLSLEVILEMWLQVLGLDVEIQQVEWATYLEDLDAQKFQAFAGLGWSADYPDPQDFLDILFHSESSINHGAYSNSEVDVILEEARTETDVVRRIDLYQRAEEKIVADAAWVPLWFTGDQYMLIKPHIKGYRLTPMIVPKLRDVSIEG